jgi:hypothetical protein
VGRVNYTSNYMEKEKLNIGYDGEKDFSYFCKSPNCMRCEGKGFSDFYYSFMGRLGEQKNMCVKYMLPSLNETGFEEVELRSIRICVEKHNMLVDIMKRS